MKTELKRQIFNWLCANENEFQRINTCKEEFMQYIFMADGSYCIGGEEVHEFISSADKLI